MTRAIRNLLRLDSLLFFLFTFADLAIAFLLASAVHFRNVVIVAVACFLFRNRADHGRVLLLKAEHARGGIKKK